MNLQEKYNTGADSVRIGKRVDDIIRKASEIKDDDLYKKIFGLIDLTSLDVSDTDEKIMSMIAKVNQFTEKFSNRPNVAAICVYPPFVRLMKAGLKDKNVKKATVAGSFPSSQTFSDIKFKEVEQVLKEGADEVDIVLPVGRFLEKKYDDVYTEIHTLKNLTGEKHLKVILETGVLAEPEKIKYASFLCLEAGADFIKTSTGKNGIGATPEAVYAMCETIRDFHEKTGRKAGIKPAGGISDATTAIQYYLIVEEVLGDGWLHPSLFRIGASRLANNLLGKEYF